MTKRRDSELKERLKALKVNEPLKLKNELVFKSPQAKCEVPQIEAPQIHLAQNEIPQIERAQTGTADRIAQRTSPGEAPQNEFAQSGGTQNEAAQKEAACSEVTRNESAQSKDTRIDPPQSEVPQREMGGFFKLSHRVFFEPLLRDLSGDSFRLFLWLSSRAWRYPSSDGTVRASISYIESQAGMSHATISRALKTLKEKKLVTVLEVDFKKGNFWQVSAIASTHNSPNSDPDDKPTQKKVPQNEAPQTSVVAPSIRESVSLKLRQPPPQNEGDLRSIKKNKNIKEAPAIVFPVSIGNEIDKIENEEATHAFESALAAERREQVVSKFIEKEFPHGFFPPMRVIRTMAAKDWYRAHSPAQGVAV